MFEVIIVNFLTAELLRNFENLCSWKVNPKKLISERKICSTNNNSNYNCIVILLIIVKLVSSVEWYVCKKVSVMFVKKSDL